jgi:bifunctional ADP-heptose synthase (sugar kinase/adenylyltransferase)
MEKRRRTVTIETYLDDFRTTHKLLDILAWLDRCATLRPVVVGDAIIDEYLFCDALGKSSKDPTLAVLQQSTEAYAGGALAVANHLAGLCDTVRLVTQLGSVDRQEEFIHGALRTNILATFLTKQGAPTICKRRIIDRYSGSKLLEIYCMDDTPTDQPVNVKLALGDALTWGDVVLAADFGHGFMVDKIVSRLWASGVFLAVNAQSNAGNRGFNPISKYRYANYICLANHEVDIETRQRGGDDREKLLEVTKRIACPRWTVTRGKWGTLHYDVVDETFYEAPALASKVVDRVGAGDAVFAVTSLLVRLGTPWEIVAFIGNVAGACLVENLGNKRALDRTMLETHIRELLKGQCNE